MVGPAPLCTHFRLLRVAPARDEGVCEGTGDARVIDRFVRGVSDTVCCDQSSSRKTRDLLLVCEESAPILKRAVGSVLRTSNVSRRQGNSHFRCKSSVLSLPIIAGAHFKEYHHRRRSTSGPAPGEGHWFHACIARSVPFRHPPFCYSRLSSSPGLFRSVLPVIGSTRGAFPRRRPAISISSSSC